MKEHEIKEIVKTGVKSPQDGFTDNVMSDILALNNEVNVIQMRKFWVLLVASIMVILASVLVPLPDIVLYNISFNLSPIIMPIIGLLSAFVMFQELYDIRMQIAKNKENIELQTG